MALRIDRNVMPSLPADVRKNCFNEVSVGFDERSVRLEAMRCLQCKNPPCVQGCPVNNCIPEFLAKVAVGNFAGALNSILSTHILPAVCGRVCPQELQCEGHCVLGIKGKPVAIGACERFVGDYGRRNSLAKVVRKSTERQNKPVAIVGSGPSGLSCAGLLLSYGYDVTVFEAMHEPGGVMLYGIPDFRLPKDIVRRELQKFMVAGVNFEFNTLVGRTVTVDDLFSEGYKAVFAAPGAGVPVFSNMPGESLCGVLSANEFLTRINMMKAHLPDAKTPVWCGRNVVVIGGGNTAMDAARTAIRLNPDSVTIVYRRSMEDMPARPDEISEAMEEGVRFLPLTSQVEYIGNEEGWLKALRLIKMTQLEKDASGRSQVAPINGTEFTIEADTVILAIGTKPNVLIAETTPGVETDRYGRIIVNPETMMTTRPGVFAGGDIAGGEATVIAAMRMGKKAALNIDKMLSE